MKTLLIDNYDSFTFNLFQLIAEVNRVPPIVVRNDHAPWSEIRELEFDNIVISPGPGRPEVPEDFGICRDAIEQTEVPLMGVCLGHQGLSYLFGGEVDYADTVMHGRTSAIHHTGDDSGVFADIPNPFTAVRYHSLYVKSLPEELEKTAWLDDGMIMGVRHKTRPIWGVQFHPESIGTEYGHRLFENFRSLTAAHIKSRGVIAVPSSYRNADDYNVVKDTAERFEEGARGHIDGSPFKVHYRRLPISVDADDVFFDNFAESCPSYWLDSALVRGFSRFSYMGDASGPHAEYITYDMHGKSLKVTKQGETSESDESIFPYLDRKLRERQTVVEGLPFDFNCGYAGYLGYELKGECGTQAPHVANTPDAAFVFGDRVIAFDHEEEIIYLVCLDDDETRAKGWMDLMAERLKNTPKAPPWSRALHPQPVQQTLRHTPEQYLEQIKASQAQIKKGETYEVCMTNMITNHVRIDPLNTYRALRHSNPAPYATYLNFPEVQTLSSSPERFLTIDPYGVVEAKPIKGTRKRGKTTDEDEALYEDLRTNEKDRSENLMIVDLLRNDIGVVCDVGSVHVSNIFAVESYATVHQLVSTIRGRLRRGVSSVECVKASFPGGSMTGAPKKRTMEIIDRLEGGPRGIYSGSMGFFGLNGSTDLNIVIRTIVCANDTVTVGVGGAIVDLSDPQDELDEMILKSQALVHALSETALETIPMAQAQEPTANGKAG